MEEQTLTYGKSRPSAMEEQTLSHGKSRLSAMDDQAPSPIQDKILTFSPTDKPDPER
jgi:hypothetical protein